MDKLKVDNNLNQTKGQNKPLVSIVVTTYNRNEFLKETLISIFDQSYKNIEVLVVDDGSILEIASANEKLCLQHEKCRYYYKSNLGQPDSRNYGIKRSKGDFIAFCDDDDVWIKSKLEIQVRYLLENEHIGLVSGCVEYIDEAGKLFDQKQCPKIAVSDNQFKKFLIKNRIKSPTPLLRKEIFEKVGLFNPSFTIAEDWEFWRRVSYYFKVHQINQTLAYVRFHDSNMSKPDEDSPDFRFKLYRKLTKAILLWGKDRFTHEDRTLIGKMEWKTYRKLFTNGYPGYYKKLGFFTQIAFQNLYDAIHCLYLCFKFEKYN